MNEKNKQEIRTPIDVMLEMARAEIKSHVLNCMEANNIPPAFMVHLLKSITLDIYDMKDVQLAECYVDLQKSVYESEKQEG